PLKPLQLKLIRKNDISVYSTYTACSSFIRSVKLWDLRRTYSICRLEPPLSWYSFSPVGESGRRFGFTSLTSDPWQSSLFASCTNDIIYQYSTSMLKSDPG
ncbi:Denticleless protein homolog A, partial [Geodia barretti]